MTYDDVKNLFDYHYWARDRTLDALDALTPEEFTRDLGNSFRSIRDTIAHTYSAEWVWNQRWQGLTPTSDASGRAVSRRCVHASAVGRARTDGQGTHRGPGRRGDESCAALQAVERPADVIAFLADVPARRQPCQLSSWPGDDDAAADWSRAAQELRHGDVLSGAVTIISMKRLVVAGLLAGAVLAAHGDGLSPPAAQAQGKPNIILIQADDLGYGDLSAYGQAKFSTPGIDRLAREGIRFTNYYSGSTVCAPSRAALMTGMHTGHGVDSWQRRDSAARQRRDSRHAAARRWIQDRSHRQVGTRRCRHLRATGQEGIRLLVRLSRSSPRASPVHRSPVPEFAESRRSTCRAIM